MRRSQIQANFKANRFFAAIDLNARNQHQTSTTRFNAATTTTVNTNNERQRAAKTVTKRAQELPKAAQDPIKTAQKPAKTCQRGPKSPQEPSWNGLGAIWDHPITRSKTRSLRIKFPHDFGSILAPQIGPKTTPRRPQNESKINTKNASLFYRSWTRRRPVLRRSWAHLGGMFGNFALVFFQWFREHRHFRVNDGSRRILDPT